MKCTTIVVVLSVCAAVALGSEYQQARSYDDGGYKRPSSAHGDRHGAGYGSYPSGYRGGRYYYGGKYAGKCANDGLYYRDEYSFVICSNGNNYVQPCAPGTRNSGQYNYSPGYYYGYSDFCDINLVDYGYAAGYAGYRPYPVQDSYKAVESYDKPSYDKPSYDKPSYDKPSYDKPSYDKPSYDKPSYDSYDKPSYEKPSYNKPSYDKPSYDEPSYDSYGEKSYSKPAADYKQPEY